MNFFYVSPQLSPEKVVKVLEATGCLEAIPDMDKTKMYCLTLERYDKGDFPN